MQKHLFKFILLFLCFVLVGQKIYSRHCHRHHHHRSRCGGVWGGYAYPPYGWGYYGWPYAYGPYPGPYYGYYGWGPTVGIGFSTSLGGKENRDY